MTDSHMAAAPLSFTSFKSPHASPLPTRGQALSTACFTFDKDELCPIYLEKDSANNDMWSDLDMHIAICNESTTLLV